MDANGVYHVADPESPVTFEAGGAVMQWEGEAHDRLSGAGLTPEGRWRGRVTGAEWEFAADGGYTVTLDGATDRGIWALRQDGAALWTREEVATPDHDGGPRSPMRCAREERPPTATRSRPASLDLARPCKLGRACPVHRPRDAAPPRPEPYQCSVPAAPLILPVRFGVTQPP